MAVPTVVQVSAVTEAVAYNTARTVTFSSDITAGNGLILLGFIANDGEGMTSAAATASVTQSGATFIRRLDFPVRYRQGAGLTVWTAQNVTGGTGVKTITVTPSVANDLNFCGLVALEVTGRTSGLFEAAVGANTEHGAFSVAVGPCPSSGSISQADTMAIFVSMVNQSTNNSNPGWVLPSGWTERAKTLSSTDAKRAIFVGSKTQTSTAAVTVTISSTEADLYGRVGALLLIRGDTGSSAPPPPAPTPSPPPPGPGPAPTPPPPGPAPAPASQAFEFLNADPAIAGEGGVVVQIHAEPTTEELLGEYIMSTDGQEWEASGSYSKLVVPHDGVVTVTTGQTVVAVAQNAGNTAGIRGVMQGTVVDL